MNCDPVRSLLSLLACFFFGAFAGPARAELTAEQVKQAKAATAILLNGEGSGSAFCISESGLFVTNYHVISNRPDSKLALVINPAATDEKRYTVRVLRKFEKEDLALIKVELDRKVPVLKLGDDSALFETQQLIAFGYPFGQMLAATETAYPAISVNIGRVSSLRKKDNVLDAIQLDAQVNPGNSGGPVLDDQGNVVGIVNSGVMGSGVNFAVPVSTLKRVSNTPVLAVTSPAVPFAKRFDPAEFVFSLDWIVPQPAEPSVVLEITAGGATRRAVAVKGGDQKYRASLSPLLPEPPGQKVKCQVSIDFNGGRIVGAVESFNLNIGGQPKPLAEIGTIKRGPAGAGFTINGQPVGDLLEIATLNVDVGGYVMTVATGSARQIDIVPPTKDVGAISYKITVTPAGQANAIASADGLVQLAAGPILPESVAAAAPLTSSVELTEKREVALPSAFDDLAAAGNGRYLIFHLKDAKKLAVFDVLALKIRGYINLAAEPALFAGGSRHILVAFPSENLIQRFSLETLEKERTISNPMGTLAALVMGYASPNLALFVTRPSSDLRSAQIHIFDTDKMAVVDDSSKSQGRFSNIASDGVVRASADGRTYGFCRRSTSPSGFTVVTYKNNELAVFYEHASVGILVPNADGSVVFTGQMGAYTAKFASIFKLAGNWSSGTALLPSYHPMYFFGVPYNYSSSSNQKEVARTVAIYTGRSADPLVNLSESFPEMQSVESTSSRNEAFSMDKRYHFFPQLNVLLTIPPTNDKIVARPVNVEKILNEKGIDYLYVTSMPPTAQASKPFQYQMTAASKAGKVAFSLQSGPDGMTVSADGKVAWMPGKAGEETVIVGLKDASGQEAFNTFQVLVLP